MTTDETTIEATPIWAVKIEHAAECLRVSPRRVRQLIEDKQAVRHGRGRVDIGWIWHWNTANTRWGKRPGKPSDPLTLVAIGWLVAHDWLRRDEEDPTPHLIGLAERNGYTAEAALVALKVAQSLFPAPDKDFL